MTIQITGKNFDVGAALREHVHDKLHDVVSKYVTTELAGHVRFEKQRNMFKTSCSIQLGWGLLLQATGEAGDAYASCDAALERIDKRLRRYKRRLVNKHHAGPSNGGRGVVPGKAVDYVITADDENDDDENTGTDLDASAPEMSDDEVANPVIIAEIETDVHVYSVRDAVMAMDLADAQCLVFKNAGTGRINIVYRRADNHIGWIDPVEQAA